ncbi:hypothetical protein Tco_0250748 [Tanacetum coccineum]
MSNTNNNLKTQTSNALHNAIMKAGGKDRPLNVSTYGKIWYDEDVHDLRSVETEFPAIVFNDSLTSNETLSCKPMVSSINDEIDFRISFDESDNEDYTPTVSCIDNLDFFKDFKNEFLAIVYNDALTSKSNFSTEPTLCPQHIDEFDLKDEISLSKYDEVEQNILYFKDLFHFNIIYPDDLKSDKGNDMAPLPPHDQRHLWLRYQVVGYTEEIVHDFEQRLKMVFGRQVNRVHILDFKGLTPDIRQDLAERMRMIYTGDDGHEIGISFAGDFLGTSPSYTSIRDLILRLCHRLITCSIAGRSQTPKKVLKIVCFGEEAMGDDIWRELPVIDMAKLVRLQIYKEIDDTWAWVAPGQERHLNHHRLLRLCHRGWPAGGMAQLQDYTGASYTPYSENHIPYQRRVRRRTDGARTSAAQQDPQQPDP